MKKVLALGVIVLGLSGCAVAPQRGCGPQDWLNPHLGQSEEAFLRCHTLWDTYSGIRRQDGTMEYPVQTRGDERGLPLYGMIAIVRSGRVEEFCDLNWSPRRCGVGVGRFRMP